MPRSILTVVLLGLFAAGACALMDGAFPQLFTEEQELCSAWYQIEQRCERPRQFLPAFAIDEVAKLRKQHPAAEAINEAPQVCADVRVLIAGTGEHEQGKPADIIDKIVEGKVDKYYSEIVLLEQSFVKDPDMTVEDYLKSIIGKLGENMQIKRFARFQIGG